MISKRKLILMGCSGAGKTSMKSMIFANYTASDTLKLQPTFEAETTTIKFLGNTHLSVWDCGGQELFLEDWFSSMKNTIFPDVAILICVIDVTNLSDPEKYKRDVNCATNCLDSLRKFSGEAKTFIMLHKIDLLEEYTKPNEKIEQNEKIEFIKGKITEKVCERLNISPDDKLLRDITFQTTTIHNDSLYSAWGEVVHNIVPDIQKYKKQVEEFCLQINADEVTLFEKRTFLPFVSFSKYLNNKQHDRNQIMTNKLKRMSADPLAISSMQKGNLMQKSHTQFSLKNRKYQLFFRKFTNTTCIFIIYYMHNQRKREKYGCYFDRVLKDGDVELISNQTSNNKLDSDSKMGDSLNKNMLDSQLMNSLIIDGQFKQKSQHVVNEPNFCELPALIEACILDFKEEMKDLDSISTPKQQPRTVRNPQMSNRSNFPMVKPTRRRNQF